jgi:hypothetical protein
LPSQDQSDVPGSLASCNSWANVNERWPTGRHYKDKNYRSGPKYAGFGKAHDLGEVGLAGRLDREVGGFSASSTRTNTSVVVVAIIDLACSSSKRGVAGMSWLANPSANEPERTRCALITAKPDTV